MVTKTSELLRSGKSATTLASTAMTKKIPKFMTANPEVTKNIKKMLKSPIGKTVLRGIPGVSSLMLLGSIAGLMKKDTLPGRLKILEDRAKEKRAGKPMKNRQKLGPTIRARSASSGAMSDSQKKGASPSEVRAAMREAGRGKAGKSLNVVKGGGGVVKRKNGNSVKSLTKAQVKARTEARRKNR